MLFHHKENFDNDQLRVIEAESKLRLLVDAGPGTGKTAVACARIAHLLDQEGIAESNIWMISFTRTAVAEIRSRLQSYVGDAAFSIKVATVDSHAWEIHSGYDKASLTGTYEDNLTRVIKLIQCDDALREELEEVEHLVIDEAQDLVGIRSQLVNLLILQLDPSCGVTVFSDSAQAIYGFSEDYTEEGLSETGTLVDQLINHNDGFQRLRLNTIHRTSSYGLKKIFHDVRNSILSEIEAPKDLFSNTRKSIQEFADESDLNSRRLNLKSVPNDSLVLFRSRAEALRHSQFSEVPHKLRLSGFGPHLPAWIAICFREYTKPVISRDNFYSIWSERVIPVGITSYDPDEAWRRLLRTAGNRDGTVNLKLLRTRLDRIKPPIELCELDFGVCGPILGTIHASKGREADNVSLLIPRQVEFQSTADEAEETRVLFVGATRARKMLNVGKAESRLGSKLDGGRAFKKVKNKAVMVEIGFPGDLSTEGLAGQKYFTESDFQASQKCLESNNSTRMQLELQASADLGWRYQLITPNTDLTLATMSKSFNNDLWEIANQLKRRKGRRLKPNSLIKYVRSFGARTVAIGEDNPILELLHPAARSGFILSPMVASFTNVYFADY